MAPTITELIASLEHIQGLDMPVTFEDEHGQRFEFVEVYSYPHGERYIVVIKPAKD